MKYLRRKQVNYDTGMTGNQHLEMTSKNMETLSSISVSSERVGLQKYHLSQVSYIRNSSLTIWSP